MAEAGQENALFRVIETDRNTGWRRYLDNMAADPWGDTFTREQADETVEWREKNITSKYGYEVVPVIAWRLDIEDGIHHDLFMLVCGQRFGEKDPLDPARVCMRDGAEQGGVVWAYTKPGAESAPEWLAKLRDFLATAGYPAVIRGGSDAIPPKEAR